MAARWTAEQLEYLERNYFKNDILDLVAIIGKTEDAIRWKASQLGWLLRDGRSAGNIVKMTLSITQDHKIFLQKHKHNQSEIIRKALDMYIKKHN